MISLLEEEEGKQMELKEMKEEAPPAKPPRDPFERKGILFYGVIQDIKMRYPLYLSDIVDGFCLQALSASLFIFFAALSAAITFGGIFGNINNFISILKKI